MGRFCMGSSSKTMLVGLYCCGQAMFERMKAEKEEGRGGERTSEQELRRKLEQLSERLSKLNTYSSWLNILTLMSLTWHFVYLGQRLGAAC